MMGIARVGNAGLDIVRIKVANMVNIRLGNVKVGIVRVVIVEVGAVQGDNVWVANVRWVYSVE